MRLARRAARAPAYTIAVAICCAVCVATWCTVPVPAHAADRSKTLNIYAWESYFPKAVIAKFETATGIHVNYTTLDSPDTAETVLAVGHSNYDLVSMNASPHLAQEIPRGFWKKLNTADLPNLRHVDPGIMKALQAADPGNLHAVPWMWGTTGLMYDADRIKALLPNAPLESLDMMFKKSVVAHFEKCGVSMLDSWIDIMPMVARYLGQAQLSANKSDLDAVLAKLLEIKPFLRRISTTGYYEQLAEGELCLALGYSGDAMIARRMAKESQSTARIEYTHAREAVPMYIDALVIPADSPNATAAHTFINFVMQPDISAEVTRYIGFATSNLAAIQLLDPDIRNNAAVFPPAAVRARAQLTRVFTAEETRAFTRAWSRFKSGQ